MSQVESNEQNYKKMVKEYNQLKDKVIIAETNKKNYEIEKDMLDKQIIDLNQALNKNDESSNQIQLTNLVDDNFASDANKKIKQLQKQIEQNDQKLKIFNEKNQDEVNELKKKLKMKNQHLSLGKVGMNQNQLIIEVQNNQQIKELKLIHHDLNQKTVQIQKLLTNNRAALSDLMISKHQRQDQLEKIVNNQQQMEKSNQNKNKLKEELEYLQNYLKELEQQKINKQQSFLLQNQENQLKSQLKNLQDEIQNQDKKIKQFNDEELKQNEHEKKKNDNDNDRNIINNLQNDNKNLSKKVEELNQALIIMKKKIKTKPIEVKPKQKINYKMKITYLQQENQILDKDLERERRKLNQFIAIKNTYLPQSELNQLKEQNERIIKDIEKTGHTFEQQKNINQKKKKNITKFENKIQFLQNTDKKMVNEKEEKLRNLQEKNKKIFEQTNFFEKQIMQNIQKLKEYQKQFPNYQADKERRRQEEKKEKMLREKKIKETRQKSSIIEEGKYKNMSKKTRRSMGSQLTKSQLPMQIDEPSSSKFQSQYYLIGIAIIAVVGILITLYIS